MMGTDKSKASLFLKISILNKFFSQFIKKRKKKCLFLQAVNNLLHGLSAMYLMLKTCIAVYYFLYMVTIFNRFHSQNSEQHMRLMSHSHGPHGTVLQRQLERADSERKKG